MSEADLVLGLIVLRDLSISYEGNTIIVAYGIASVILAVSYISPRKSDAYNSNPACCMYCMQLASNKTNSRNRLCRVVRCMMRRNTASFFEAECNYHGHINYEGSIRVSIFSSQVE